MNIFTYMQKHKIITFIKKWNLVVLIMGLIDLLLIITAFQFAFRLNHQDIDINYYQRRSYLTLFICMLPVWFLLLHMNNITHIPRTTKYSKIFKMFVQFSLFNFSIMSFLAFLIDMVFKSYITFSFVLNTTLGILVFLYTCRLIEYRILKFYRKAGYNYRNVIIITDEPGKELIEKIIRNKEWGYRIFMILSNSPVIFNKFRNSIRIYPIKVLPSIKHIIEADTIDEVILYKQDLEINEVRSLLKTCEEIGVEFRLYSEQTSYVMTNAHLTYIGKIPFHTFTLSNDYNIGTSIKTALDIIVSFVIVMMLLPVFLVFAILIKMDSPGPVIFKQARVGLRGRQFYLYKFRTMVVNAEALRKELEQQNEMDGPVFKITNDPRITKIGKILRKTGLDELPQFINVLKGDMSLIGPRPPLSSETAKYERWQLRRLSVKPGITCFWQIVPGRNNVKFDQWVKMDLDYIDGWSIKTDIKLFLNTIMTIFASTGK